LTKLEDDAFAWAMEAGRIYPDIARHEVHLIGTEFRAMNSPAEEPAPTAQAVNVRYEATPSRPMAVMARVERDEPDITPEEARVVMAAYDRWLEQGEIKEGATHVSLSQPTGQRFLQVDDNAHDAEIRRLAFRAMASFHNIAEAGLTPEQMAGHARLDGEELAKVREAIAWLTSFAAILEVQVANVDQQDGPEGAEPRS
jgi:hypothetical protein